MGGDGGVIAVKRAWMRGTHESSHKSSKQSGGQNYGAGMTGGDAETGLDSKEKRAIRARSCHLSAEVLRAPIVADELGNLYNKLAILEALSEQRLPVDLNYIRGLKDLRDCRLTPSPGEDTCITVCPVTGQALDGSRSFVLLWTSGWLLSQSALDSVGLDNLQAEYGPCESQDLIRLFPSDDLALADLKNRMIQRRQKARLKRKHKRSERTEEAPEQSRKKKNQALPVVLPSDAARIAARAKETIREKRDQDTTLNDIFHEEKKEDSLGAASSKFTDPNKLFIATAGHRYTLS